MDRLYSRGECEVLLFQFAGGVIVTLEKAQDGNVTQGVVYCIHCSQCGLLYIGETKRKFGHRFVEHLRTVRHKQQHLPVTNHFNSPYHSLDDMSILGLLQCHNNTTQKLEEKHLIFRLG
eukprot:g17023.t1